MALLCTRMAADCLVLSTGLSARLSCVLAILRTMAILPAEMRATFERLPTHLSTACIGQPTGNVFQHPLTAQARFLGQERTLGTALFIRVAGMRGLRMTTSLWALAWEVASRWLCTTWLWWIQNRSSAITRDLFEHCFSAGIAGSLVAKLWACVSSAFQHSTTHASADMLRLDILLCRSEMRPELTTRSLALVRPLLSWTAPLSACVSTAV